MTQKFAIFLLLLSPCVPVCTAQQGNVSNAIGSLSSRTNTVAPGMLAILRQAGSTVNFNSGLFAVIGAIPLPPAPAPADVSNILIRPAGATATLPVNILSSVSGTATFIVPAGVPYGAAEILWQANGVYQATNVYVARSNFELAQAGPGGPAKTQVLSAAGVATDTGLATPARPGQTLLLSGSGLGYGTQVTATIGGLPATVVYAGRNGLRPGYDQIQLQIPAGIGNGCFVPLSLNIGSAVVNSSLSVTSDGSACPHPFQLSTSDLKILDQGGSLAAGLIEMRTDLQASLDTAASRTERANFFVNAWSTVTLPATVSAVASCDDLTAPFLISVAAFRIGDFSPTPVPQPVLPDAGATVALQNGGTTLKFTNGGDFSVGGTYSSAYLPPAQESSLANLPPAVLLPGKWIWSSPGSADLDASSFTFNVPTPIRLSAAAPDALRRDQDQTIQWNGASFDSTSRVSLSLTGRGLDGTTRRIVSCSASASAGSITIPAALLSPFAPASIGSLHLQAAPSIESLPHTLLKTKKGDTLLLYVQYSSSDTRPVDFR
jgi:uncharacterized protein (TIGR03437 family)